MYFETYHLYLFGGTNAIPILKNGADSESKS
jgi:hypothetical protein